MIIFWPQLDLMEPASMRRATTPTITTTPLPTTTTATMVDLERFKKLFFTTTKHNINSYKNKTTTTIIITKTNKLGLSCAKLRPA